MHARLIIISFEMGYHRSIILPLHVSSPLVPDCGGRSAGEVKLLLIHGLSRCRKELEVEVEVEVVRFGSVSSKSSLTGSKSYFEGVAGTLGRLFFSTSTL